MFTKRDYWTSDSDVRPKSDVPKPPTDVRCLAGNRPGSVKVTFQRGEIRDAVYSCRRDLKGSQVFLKEDLSKSMRNLDFEARKVFKQEKILRYFTRKDHVLLVFEADAAGAKVRSKNSYMAC